MMAGPEPTPEAIAADMVAAVLRGDVTRALALISEDAVDHSPLPGAPAGHDGWLAKWDNMARAGAGLDTVVEQRISAGDTVATRYRLRRADTGETVGFALDMVRVDDGKIIEHWAQPLPQPIGSQ